MADKIYQNNNYLLIKLLKYRSIIIFTILTIVSVIITIIYCYFHLRMSALHKVFVYGTLKRGEPNHHWFKKNENSIANFICEAKTVIKYPLIIATKYNIPFLLYQPGMGHNVLGELYEVDDAALEKLDVLEDHPNYYIREQNTVVSCDGATVYENTWIYFLKTFKPALLQKPMLERYNNAGPHGLKYLERYLRDPVYDHVSEIKLINFSENQSTIDDTNQ